MQRFILQIAMVMVALAGFTPALTLAQSPVVANPPAGPAIEVTILADTANLTMANSDATPAPMSLPVEHRLVRITMQPDVGFRTGSVMQSALIYVTSGSIALSTVNTAASVSVGSGQPIASADDDGVICERDVCTVEPGQAVVVGAGNSFVLEEDAINVETAGNDNAVFEMSAVFTAGYHELCWICPTY